MLSASAWLGAVVVALLCSPTTAQVRLACPAGQYATPEATVCSVCGLGTFSTANATACSVCPNGSFALYASRECTRCPPGTAGTGGTCTPCPAGKFTSALGATSCLDCPAGRTSTGGASACTQCLVGTFSQTNGSSSCTRCADGFYSGYGATSCLPCPRGTSGSGGVCTLCPAGTESTATNATQCTSCQDGFVSSSSGATQCTACATGSISNTARTACVKVATQLPSGFVACASQDRLCSFNGVQNVVYGTAGGYITLSNVSSPYECSDARAEADPAVGLRKSCFIPIAAATNITSVPSSYVKCADDGLQCAPRQGSIILYGAAGRFFEVNATTPFNCTSGTLGFDPAPTNASKACYVAYSDAVQPSAIPPDYVKCADERAQCVFQASTTIIYGSSGKFVSLNARSPFGCNNTNVNSDPLPGATKACYVPAAATQVLSAVPPGYVKCAPEYLQCEFNAPTTVLYGANGRFYSVPGSSPFSCTNGNAGGDPAPGATKSCWVPSSVVRSKFVDGYVACADENQACYFNSPTKIYYGGVDRESFFFVNANSPFICNNQEIGADSAPGVAKSCYIEDGARRISAVPANFRKVANQRDEFQYSGASVTIIFGTGTSFVTGFFRASELTVVRCGTERFGDPAPGRDKACYAPTGVSICKASGTVTGFGNCGPCCSKVCTFIVAEGKTRCD